MLDLETLGTAPGSVILSIGAVKFNENGVYDDFHIGINIQSCLDAGLTINGSTLMWWMDPERNEARAQWVDPGFDKFDLESALVQFHIWLHQNGPNEIEMWGNGANFDNNLLGAAYAAYDPCKRPQPWKFWNDRCYRTMKSMYPAIKMPKREGTHHNAVDDATSQVNHLILMPAFQELCALEKRQENDTTQQLKMEVGF